jgi:transposase
MRACDVDRLLRILETGRARAMREVSRSLEIVLCYEVGYDGFWLARLLMARGIRTIVFDPASFLKPRRGRLAKTDRLDAEEMTRILRSWLSGDHAIATAGAFPRSRRKMPSVSSVSARTLLRSGLVSSAG